MRRLLISSGGRYLPIQCALGNLQLGQPRSYLHPYHTGRHPLQPPQSRPRGRREFDARRHPQRFTIGLRAPAGTYPDANKPRPREFSIRTYSAPVVELWRVQQRPEPARVRPSQPPGCPAAFADPPIAANWRAAEQRGHRGQRLRMLQQALALAQQTRASVHLAKRGHEIGTRSRLVVQLRFDLFDYRVEHLASRNRLPAGLVRGLTPRTAISESRAVRCAVRDCCTASRFCRTASLRDCTATTLMIANARQPTRAAAANCRSRRWRRALSRRTRSVERHIAVCRRTILRERRAPLVRAGANVSRKRLGADGLR